MKKRIAFISDHSSPIAALGGVDSGGENVYIDKLARQLALFGYEIDIFTRRENEALPEAMSNYPGVRVIHIEAGPKKWIPKEELIDYLDEFTAGILGFISRSKTPYQLVHANFFMSAHVAAEIKKNFGIPFVVTFHALGKIRRIFQGKEDNFSDERFNIEERAIRDADQIIAECPQDYRDLVDYYHAAEEKLSVIPCGFDNNEFYPMDQKLARAILGIPADEKIVLQLGRMVPRKGVDNVIKSIALLKDKYGFGARLLIVGGESDQPDPDMTPEIGRLMQIAKEEGVEDRVTFIGRRSREQLKFYYNAADVFVSTPWYEPFGITPLEAMACGVPVIGSNVGGIKYSVVDRITGFLVEPNDPSFLSRQLFRILSNDGLRERLSKNGIKRVNKMFTWEAIARRFVLLYEKVIYRLPVSRIYKRGMDVIDKNLHSLIDALFKSQKTLSTAILEASHIISRSLLLDHKVLAAGNGGSAMDAQHLATEMVGHFMIDGRPALPAIALTADSAIVTAIANDFSYDRVFERQIEAYGSRGDVFIAISTSGNSANIIEALKSAQKKGMFCIGLTGKDGGRMVRYCDMALVVPSDSVQTIQEMHTQVIHTICELVEKELFESRGLSIPAMESKPIEGLANGLNIIPGSV